MKNPLLLLGAALVYGWLPMSCFGQVILKTEVTNPEPRAGEEIIFSMDNTYLVDMLHTQLDSLNTQKSQLSLDAQSAKVNLTIMDTGMYQIGPFNFSLNGVNYTTSPIQVHVIEPLPAGEGVWVRASTINNKQVVILEQHISEDDLDKASKKEKNEDNPFSDFAQNTGFVGLRTQAENPTVSFSFRRSESSGSNKMFYFIAIYEVDFLDNAASSYVLKASDFVNLPKGTQVPAITLSNITSE